MQRIIINLYSLAKILARYDIAWTLIIVMLPFMNRILKIRPLRETESLLAILHPQPSYTVHVLLLPKRRIEDLLDLEEKDNQFLADLFEAVKSLVEELGLEEQGYRLIANGGKYQEFPILHFHLVSGDEIELSQ
jgi:histidine triad (HIT) family protein